MQQITLLRIHSLKKPKFPIKRSNRIDIIKLTTSEKIHHLDRWTNDFQSFASN